MSLPATPLLAQTTVLVSGTVTDPTGARLPNAHIHAEPPPHTGYTPADTITDARGHFSLTLLNGTWILTASAAGFTPASVTVPDTASRLDNLELRLHMATVEQHILIDDSDPASTSSGADIVLRPEDLKALSDDDDVFRQQLTALLNAGPGHGQVVVDGFTGARIPPKRSILAVRYVANGYSAVFDQFGSRLEIATKPGEDTFHGSVAATTNGSALNSNSPFVTNQPGYYELNLDATLSGPVTRNAAHRTSFFAEGGFNDRALNAVITTPIDPVTFAPVTTTTITPSPTHITDDTLRLDHQLTATNNLTARYNFVRSTQSHAGLGTPLTLLSEANDNSTTTSTLQLSDTQPFGARTVLETKLQWIRTRLHQSPLSTAPTVLVEGNFNTGGSAQQQITDHQDRIDLQALVSRQLGKHYLRFGGRYRFQRDANLSTANYNGQYIYTSLANYQADQGAATPTHYSQYSVTIGRPNAAITTSDLGAYLDDEWKPRTDLTLGLGLRLESQSAFPDPIDLAPRLGLTWAVGQTPKRKPLFFVRSGFGIFYDRFPVADLLTSVRQNGVTQRTLITTPTSSTSLPSTWTLDPAIRSPLNLIANVGLDRTFNKYLRASVNYIHQYGTRQWVSRNINTPIAGAYPLGSTQPVYQFTSLATGTDDGIYSALRVTWRGFTAFASGNLHHDFADTGLTPSSLASNAYNIAADRGHFPTLPRRALYLSANQQLPHDLRLDLFLNSSGGLPFNITTGTDLNGDGIYNDRPAYATHPTAASVLYQTRYGLLDANPQPGEPTIPAYLGHAPSYLFLQLGMHKQFAFGPRAAAPPTPAGQKPAPPGSPRYTLTFAAQAANLLNHPNYGVPVGVLSSPDFGRSLTLSDANITNPGANRVLFFRTELTF